MKNTLKIRANRTKMNIKCLHGVKCNFNIFSNRQILFKIFIHSVKMDVKTIASVNADDTKLGTIINSMEY